jgi:hypothetical protein
VSIEKLDDVAIEYDSGTADLEQLKHSLNSGKTYGDSDKAVWRTLGNWARGYPAAASVPGGLRFFLTTNGAAAAGSALKLLGPDRDDDDVNQALTQLSAAASGSTNQDTATDRSDFLTMPVQLRRAMLGAVTFLEDMPNLAALSGEIEEALGYACELEDLPRFRNELEGWWFDRVMSQWTKGVGATIPLAEVEGRISYLRERYKIRSLSIDVEEPVSLEPLDDRVFIRQIRELNVGSGRLKNAQRDYLKASAQRSKWVREFKVDPTELNAYDASLTERWSTKSEILKDELQATATEDDKCQIGRRLLGWAEQQEVPIRNARAQFLTSGSYHALADALHVGWHPEFTDRFST